jgi:Calx-beta domain
VLLNCLFQPAKQPRTARLSVEALDERVVPASLSVGDTWIAESDGGIQYAEAIVRLSAPVHKTVTVNYHTVDGTATAGSDYGALSGKLSFAPGQISKTILVPVYGDLVLEPHETFLLQIDGAKNVNIADGTGVVTIFDDEPHVGVGGAWVVEGNSGMTLMTFTVYLSAACDEAVTVNYHTVHETAWPGEDYLDVSGVLTFARGETSKTVTVEVLGDSIAEPDETIYLSLSDASPNALIESDPGVGTIWNDDNYNPF